MIFRLFEEVIEYIHNVLRDFLQYFLPSDIPVSMGILFFSVSLGVFILGVVVRQIDKYAQKKAEYRSKRRYATRLLNAVIDENIGLVEQNLEVLNEATLKQRVWRSIGTVKPPIELALFKSDERERIGSLSPYLKFEQITFLDNLYTEIHSLNRKIRSRNELWSSNKDRELVQNIQRFRQSLQSHSSAL